ncbi:MAG: helix-turn-helix domain-containing protein [Bryobacteraceae bacterium]
MASVSFAPDSSSRRVALSRIDRAVSARLGPTSGLGNSQPACFNRQVAMYLAKHVGRWSTTVIGRFYDGRDHSTVCHGIQRIESLRESNPDLDSLLSNLKCELLGDGLVHERTATSNSELRIGLNEGDLEQLADLIADRVYARLKSSKSSSPTAPPFDLEAIE